MNLMLRGGRVKYVGFMMVGKAREVSFDGTNQFNFKISSGNGRSSSRGLPPPGEAAGLFPLALVFPIQRGHLLRRVPALRVARRVHRVQADDRDAARGDVLRGGDAFDSVGFHEEVGLEMLYPSQWMIQASLVMAWPSMLEGWLDGGLVKMFQRFYEHSLSGVAHLQHVHRQDARVRHRPHRAFRAIYKSTRRGMNMRSSFVHLYTTYASSHVTPSMGRWRRTR